ncbi:hypothetical protein C9374_006554 [Naegleria lovaniensis]|uniref:Uncharacterized protein n=1 Tax=Naegleria lovaniensis TaxID=51637 RepID=A0AA88KGS3_NAELO|nr:uncharacterized protein C9374_006554 [Naegleria lovaniensis]KAG2379437.1 hypothetical protein C9374_006554 [Naegleria lovaniensis]
MMTVAGGGNIEFHRNSPPDMKVPATSVQLGFPSYVYAPGNGYFYLSNDDYCRIMRVSQKDGMIESVVGNGECGDFKDHTPASKSTVHMYRFVVSKFNGDMFFGGDQGIFKVALSQPDGLIYSMTSSNRSDGFSWVDKVRNPDDGTLSVKNYIAPIQGITLGSDMNAKGDLYFAQGPGRITRIVQSGSSNDKSQWKLQTLFGSKTYMIDGIPANYVNPQSLSAVFKVSPKTSSRLVTPGDFIYLDVQYIRRIANQSTIVSTLFVDTNGDAVDIASDSKDSFYYASDHLLYHYNMTSQEMKLIAGIKGQEGYSPDGSPAKSSTLGSLTAIIAHPVTGQVVFIEEQSVVRTIDSNGLLQTLAGGGDLKYKSGIPPRQASLRSPTMLQYSSDGSKLYICDQHYSVIMMVTFNSTSAPLLYIVAGSQQSFNDGQDGIPATQASLSSPSSFLVLPSSGDLLISEFSLIRRVSVKTGLIYTVYGKIATGYTPDGPFKGTSSYLVTPNLMNIDPYDGGNVIYFGDTFSNVLRSIETSCPDHSWRLDETWSSCVKCSPGTKSTKDFVYCV